MKEILYKCSVFLLLIIALFPSCNNVRKENNEIMFNGVCIGDFEKLINEYFDLDTDYRKYKKRTR